MNIFKRLLVIFVSILIILSMAACSSQTDNVVTVASKYQIPQNEYKKFFVKQSNEKHDLVLEKGVLGSTIKAPTVYYIGKLKDNKAHGIGMAIYIPFSISGYEVFKYTGTFIDGFFIEGKIYYQKKYILEKAAEKKAIVNGIVNRDLIQNFIYSDIKYDNSIIDKIFSTSILIYDGDLKDSKYNGKGNLYDSTTGKLTYKGEFKDDKYDGNGSEYDYSGEVLIYEGMFKNGEYDGQGKLYDTHTGAIKSEGLFANGDLIKGKIYVDNKGTSILVYDGELKDSKYNGKGNLYDSTTGKLTYKGEFKDDKYDGNGSEYDYSSEVLIYEGTFKNGEYDGQGKLYDVETGAIKFEGLFENGDIKG